MDVEELEEHARFKVSLQVNKDIVELNSPGNRTRGAAPHMESRHSTTSIDQSKISWDAHWRVQYTTSVSAMVASYAQPSYLGALTA